MLDDYSLRLLAEIGVDVYVPRASPLATSETSRESPADSKPSSTVDATPRAASVQVQADIAVVAVRGQRERLLTGLLQALRFAGVSAKTVDGDATADVHAMRGIVVLGESLARRIAATFSAAQHARLEWVICGEPEVIAHSADAKRALWGEIKRISRQLAADRPDAGEVR